MKKTKIIATLGPSSETQKDLEKMIVAGVNACRLNFSHGNYDWHTKMIGRIRKAEKKLRKKVGIMADIQGPRVRVANHKQVSILEGETIFLTDGQSKHNDSYEKDLILDWKGFFEYLKRGDNIYIEDGLIQLEIVRRISGGCSAKVLVGGKLKPHKGVNIPSISKHLGFLTSKDLEDLKFILSKNVDFIAASFVSTKDDVKNLRIVAEQFLKKENDLSGSSLEVPWIISKIERRKAIKNIGEIIKVSDGIMIARGDLAIETSQEKVGVYQKDIISQCRKAGKPVIVATQMMASMVSNPRPTRAEISDVTNAIVDNADAVMLSNESAVGKYPIDVIETMSKIIKNAEESPYNDVKLKKSGKLGRLLFSRKKRKIKIYRAKTVDEARKVSSLRQENVKISLISRKISDKRKGTVIWGVY